MRLRPTPLVLVLALAVLIAPVSAHFAAAQGADPVLAKVNGVEIHQSDLTMAEADVGESLPADTKGDKRRDLLLSYLINVNLLSQAAEAKKIDKAPDFAKRIAFARKKVLVQAMMEQDAKKSVTDADIKKFYDDNLKPQTEVHARHILVETEAQAKEIEAKLKGGADFAKLAKEVSKDPGSDGGDLGYITKDQVVPEFGNVAFSLEKGKISDPVKSQFGWHIIKIEDKRERQPPPFDSVKERIKTVLVQKAGDDLMKEARDKAKIEQFTTPAAPPTAPADPKKK